MMEVISRAEARELGLKFYFTGKPCKHGHVSERYVSTHFCKKCMDKRYEDNSELVKERVRLNYQANQDKYLAKKREYFHKNKEVLAEKNRERYQNNKERVAERSKEYRSKNKDKIKEMKRKYASENLELINHYSAKRRAAKRQAVPKWLTDEDKANIKAVYTMALRISGCLGVKHHVDHIVPLRGENVCGLHVPWNLAAIPAKLNMSKRNKLPEDVQLL
jgi:hypothetical protein